MSDVTAVRADILSYRRAPKSVSARSVVVEVELGVEVEAEAEVEVEVEV